MLTQAVERDPKLARAWVWLASAHDLAVHFGADVDTARAAAMQAIHGLLNSIPWMLRPMLPSAIFSGWRAISHERKRRDCAFRLNPSDAGILTNYAGWASTFGDPERGAQAADRAMRLNPSYSTSAAGFFRLAYLMAGRYEDALRLVEREDPQTRTRGGWVQRAMVYAALGRKEEAQSAVADALKRHPDLTIESFALHSPGYSDVERRTLVEGMRAAGFPPCARPEQLQAVIAQARLPECITVSPQSWRQLIQMSVAGGPRGREVVRPSHDSGLLGQRQAKTGSSTHSQKP